jgi:hypothetical protein
VLQTGHGVLGTTHAEDLEKLVNRVIEKGLPAYLLREIDLVVFPKHVDGDRYVGGAVELLSEREASGVGGTRRIEKDGTAVHPNRVLDRTPDGDWTFAYDHPKLGDPTRHRGLRTLDRIADRTDRPVEDVEAEFHRKHGYVEYMVRDGMTDMDAVFGFLSDLRTDEAATVERLQRRHAGRTDD